MDKKYNRAINKNKKKERLMTETRTKVSENYIRPSNTSTTGSTTSTNTTHTRVSGNYIKPSSTYCGRTIYSSSPSCYSSPSWYSRYPSSYYYPSSNSVYTSPTFSATRVSTLSENIAGAFITAFVVGAIALIALAPRCHYEEICQNIPGTGLASCYLERVCLH